MPKFIQTYEKNSGGKLFVKIENSMYNYEEHIRSKAFAKEKEI